jgi:hypothetical protein
MVAKKKVSAPKFEFKSLAYNQYAKNEVENFLLTIASLKMELKSMRLNFFGFEKDGFIHILCARLYMNISPSTGNCRPLFNWRGLIACQFDIEHGEIENTLESLLGDEGLNLPDIGVVGLYKKKNDPSSINVLPVSLLHWS